MLKPAFLYDLLKEHGVEFSLGVPDSLLKYFCSYAFDQGSRIIAANEGAAIGIATGYHLASGKIPMVYMQNSGFGNTVNPLTSLTDPEVYAIPMLLMIGWRGMPGTKDEPQHVKQGRTMEAQLQALEIPYIVLSGEWEEAQNQVEEAIETIQKTSGPFAVLVPPGIFEEYKLESEQRSHKYTLGREEVLRLITEYLGSSDIVVSTTGKTSRELFELRAEKKQGHQQDFLTVGSMGHASQIALGIAIEKPDKKVFCIDGDGALIMHMGSLAVIGELSPKNFKQILINNGAHESVGGQPTAGFVTNFGKITEACGYKDAYQVSTIEELEQVLPEFIKKEGPVLLEIMTKTGSRKDLGRPTIAPKKNKEDFMSFISEGEN